MALNYADVVIPRTSDDDPVAVYSPAFVEHWMARFRLFVEALEEHLEDPAVDPSGLGAERIWMWFGIPEEIWTGSYNTPRAPSRQSMFADIHAELRRSGGRALASFIATGSRPNQLRIASGLTSVIGRYETVTEWFPTWADALLGVPDLFDPLRPMNRKPVDLDRPGSVWHGSLFDLGDTPLGLCMGATTPCWDDYGVELLTSHDEIGAIRPVLDVRLSHNNTRLGWKDHEDWPDRPADAIWNTNRTLDVEVIRRQQEAADNIRILQDMNLERIEPRAPVVHSPTLYGPSAGGTLGLDSWEDVNLFYPANQARHCFWAGLHHADALWLYPMNSRDSAADGAFEDIESPFWRAYRRGAGLLRGHPQHPDRPTDPTQAALWDGFREAMANGERILGTTVQEQDHHVDYPVDWIRVRVDPARAPEVDYGIWEDVGQYTRPDYGRTLADTLPAVQWSARRLGDVVWLIVSHGYRPVETNDYVEDLDSLGSFGFDSDLGIASATVLDATDMAVPVAFPHDGDATFIGSGPDEEGMLYRFTRIDAMLVRIELG